MEKILITGITGFIGTHLARKLVDIGYEVYGITKPSVTRDIETFKDFLSNTDVKNCDIADYYSTNNVIKSINPDVIVHLAALSPVRDSFEKPFSYINTNIVGTTNIVQSILGLPDYKDKKLIYASTAEVYGEQRTKHTAEDVALTPTSPYAITKAATDMYVRMVSRVYGMDTTVMRSTNSYGRKFDKSFFVEYLITNMLSGKKVYIGAPDSIRDYMYVDDHVDAYVKAIQIKHESGEAFNFSAGIEMTNKETAFRIADLIGFNKNDIVLGKYPPGYPSRPLLSDQTFISLDSSKAKKVFGWESKIGFPEGIGKTIRYWTERTKRNKN